MRRPERGKFGGLRGLNSVGEPSAVSTSAAYVRPRSRSNPLTEFLPKRHGRSGCACAKYRKLSSSFVVDTCLASGHQQLQRRSERRPGSPAWQSIPRSHFRRKGTDVILGGICDESAIPGRVVAQHVDSRSNCLLPPTLKLRWESGRRFISQTAARLDCAAAALVADQVSAHPWRAPPVASRAPRGRP
jgi:hypothetical protein